MQKIHANLSVATSDSTVENAVAFSYCLFTVSMFFCGSTKLKTTINQDRWNEMPVYTLF